MPAGPTLKTRRNTSADRAYDALRDRIVDGRLPPGSQHLEQSLADTLGLSRTPVREALIRLHNDGLVEVIPRHGARILPISVADMEDIYMILVGLEPIAASRLAERGATAAELDALLAATQVMEAALEAGNLETWAQADETFHLTIVNACGNQRLADIIMNSWLQVKRVRRLTLRLRDPSHPRLSAIEHHRVIEAIAARDADLAADIFREHRARGGREQIEVLTSLGISQV